MFKDGLLIQQTQPVGTHMKKTILVASVTALAACSSMAQGIMTFTTSGTTHPIEYSLSGGGTDDTKVPVGNPAQIPVFGRMNVAVYSTIAGTAITFDANSLPNLSINGWTQASIVDNSITFTAGTLGSVSETMGTAGNPVQIEVVGWTGTANSWQQAEADFIAGTDLVGFSGSILSGGALGWTQPTGTSTSPAALQLGNTAFNVLVIAPETPEPSTIALGGLAAALVIAFRRRK
jgi:hypothetical protein